MLDPFCVFAALAIQFDPRELKRNAKKLEALLGVSFQLQKDFILDPEKTKVLACPRRSGKTHALMLYLLYVCLGRPDRECFFLAPTKEHAQRLIWRPMKALCKQLGIEVEFKDHDARILFPNGSIAYVISGDSVASVDIIRGGAPDLIIADEAGSIRPDVIKALVTEITEAALADSDGTLVLSGTPPKLPFGFFWDCGHESAFRVKTRGKKRVCVSRPHRERKSEKWADVHFEWSFHNWSVQENEARPDIWPRMLARHEKTGRPDNDPRWLREAHGVFISSNTDLVFNFDIVDHTWEPDPKKSTFGLPEGHDWRFVFGIDIGYVDNSVVQVGAYAQTYHIDGAPILLHVFEETLEKALPSQIAQAVISLRDVFGSFEMGACDGGAVGRSVIQEFRDRYAIDVDPVAKHQKRHFISLFNDGLETGHIKVLKNSRLSEELLHARWRNPKKQDLVSNATPDDHIDAFMYLRRVLLEQGVDAPDAPPLPGTEAFHKQATRKMIEQMKRHADRQAGVYVDGIDDEQPNFFQHETSGSLWN